MKRYEALTCPGLAGSLCFYTLQSVSTCAFHPRPSKNASGQSLLLSMQVRDNGEGMSLPDLYHCGKPGHTSKIRSSTDLSAEVIETLGCHGEALASLSQFCTLEISTLPRNDPAGGLLKIVRDGGTEELRRTSDRRENGTTVTCRQLFHNRPVVRKVISGGSRVHEVMHSCAFWSHANLWSDTLELMPFLRRKQYGAKGAGGEAHFMRSLHGAGQPWQALPHTNYLCAIHARLYGQQAAISMHKDSTST